MSDELETPEVDQSTGASAIDDGSPVSDDAAIAAAMKAVESARASAFGSAPPSQESDAPAAPSADEADPLDIPDPLADAATEKPSADVSTLMARLEAAEKAAQERENKLRAELEQLRTPKQPSFDEDGDPVDYLAARGWTPKQINDWLTDPSKRPEPPSKQPDVKALEDRIEQLQKSIEEREAQREAAAKARAEEARRAEVESRFMVEQVKPALKDSSFPFLFKAHGEAAVEKVFRAMQAEYQGRKGAYDAAGKLPTVEFVAAGMERELRAMAKKLGVPVPRPAPALTALASSPAGKETTSSDQDDDEDGEAALKRAEALARKFLNG